MTSVMASGKLFPKSFTAILVATLMLALSAVSAWADSAVEINSNVQATLNKFKADITGADEVLAKAHGVLVMPKVYKAGFIVGGEYGEGALLVNGQTVDYYNIVSGSYGFQLGAQKKSIILAFMDDQALTNFRNSDGWTIGADASVALIAVGAEGSIQTNKLNKPVVGFVIGQKGLMYDLSLEGSKFTKINK